MKARLREDLTALMRIPGLSGQEERVAAWLRARLDGLGLTHRTDRLGNLIATIPGDRSKPSVMIFTHMDQLGFIVRKVEPDGLIRVERLGGVSERAMAAQEVTLCGARGDIPGIILNKAHHATTPEEKYKVLTTPEIRIDTGHGSKAAVEAAGIRIGTPVVYAGRVIELAGDRIAGTSVDDRAGCAALLELARHRAGRVGPTLHLVWTVQEEFNLRGAVVAAQNLAPDIAIQIDLMLATDTPDMADRGEMSLGGGPGISLYSFHGRGTLNGVIPHPALVRLMEDTAAALALPLQRSAQVGVLTDLSYVQLLGDGVAAIDVGFPMRHSHSAVECCDLGDLAGLVRLLDGALDRIPPAMKLERD
ncbi:M20/M25/M40 family metallo-hydrolase [bacterium]|nr:M20/M25/M40 family metallo-hydrolase [bacterium]